VPFSDPREHRGDHALRPRALRTMPELEHDVGQPRAHGLRPCGGGREIPAGEFVQEPCDASLHDLFGRLAVGAERVGEVLEQPERAKRGRLGSLQPQSAA
jgi:hypothetical protein